ncbi:MAG TPA: prolipoprotein diacylglyceryl transferase [Candidatus Polarisedimenticolia bacterium]|jgi:phosphatidylglycerol:prolipoprotein diacylglycerol transferase|nr:prolipoprotein diacylglyceryl transferase [Candidatus Polarisedimenticolia bacterium]
MHPVLFDLPLGPLGTFTVGTYGLFYALGFLLGLRLAVSYARQDGIEPSRILDLGIVGLLAGFVGAKLLLYALDARYYLAEPVRMLQNLRSAGVYYGGLGLAVAAGVWYVRRHRLPLGKVADLCAPALSLGQAIGRIGCFLAGCCYGRACDLPWGVTFHDPRAAELTGVPVGVRLHPTQLYHAAADVLTLVVAMALMRRRRFDGQVFWTWLLLYSVLRAVVEHWRGDMARGVFFSGALSTSQVISIPIALVSALMLWRLGRRASADSAAAAARPRGR